MALCRRHLRKVHEYTAEFVELRLVQMQQRAERVLDAAQAKPPVVLPDRGNEPGWVYLIRLGDRIKIGYTTDVYRRLRDLPYEQVLAILPGSFRTEGALHRRFDHLRIRVAGEWFRVADELLEFAHEVAS